MKRFKYAFCLFTFLLISNAVLANKIVAPLGQAPEPAPTPSESKAAASTIHDPWNFCPSAENYWKLSLKDRANSSQGILTGKVLKIYDKQTDNPKEIVSNRCWADVEITHWYKQPSYLQGQNIRIVAYFSQRAGIINDINKCPLKVGSSYLFFGTEAKSIAPGTSALHVNPICGGVIPEEFASGAINSLTQQLTHGE